MNSNFEYYKVFYYVAKYENLTKASSVLKTSQPAVTRTIHNLENELGCRLFTRSKSGMKLTPEGRTFYSYVSAGCAQFFKGENDLSNLISLENGTIYISATETALHCFLFRAMGEFNSIYPNVHFKILNNSTMDSVNAVKEGKVDLAFVSTDLQVNKPLRMKKLREYHEVLIGGSRYIELKGRKISLEELSAYPWISLTSEALTRKFLNNYFADHGLQFLPDIPIIAKPNDGMPEVVDGETVYRMTPEEFAEEEKKAENVFEIEVEEKLPTRNIILIYDTEYPQSIASKEFQKFLSSQKN